MIGQICSRSRARVLAGEVSPWRGACLGSPLAQRSSRSRGRGVLYLAKVVAQQHGPHGGRGWGLPAGRPSDASPIGVRVRARLAKGDARQGAGLGCIVSLSGSGAGAGARRVARSRGRRAVWDGPERAAGRWWLGGRGGADAHRARWRLCRRAGWGGWPLAACGRGEGRRVRVRCECWLCATWAGSWGRRCGLAR